MPLLFPSAAWTSAYKDAINQNPLYRKTAANWSEGAVALVCKAEPTLGLNAPQAIILDLLHGECRGAVHATDLAALEGTPFVIEATYEKWKAVIGGALDPIKAMLQGQLKLTKGHLPTIIRDVEGSKQLVLSARTIDTEFLSAP